ncbi:MAG: hypothetical protein ABID09_08195 [Candidatus Omnitrophota bacterium]
MSKGSNILALGADMKSRYLVASGSKLEFGPEIGDLGEARNFAFFKRKVQQVVKRTKPAIITHDLHPGYFSTRLARRIGAEHPAASLLPVQHHYAHIASVMAEFGLKGPAIGVALDGTGLGTDGNIWGGEFIVVRNRNFNRVGHFKYIRMPGGEKVISEIWRMVISILGRVGCPFLKDVEEIAKEMLISMMEKGINSPLTSSVGRIFDAAASLTGVCREAAYEAEGPIKLEKLCDYKIKESYNFTISKNKGTFTIDVRPIFFELIKDLKKRTKRSVIATKFHNSMVMAVFKMVKKITEETGIKDVLLSGGVFQNSFLRRRLMEKLSKAGFKVFINEKTPVNDHNIALGQYYIAKNYPQTNSK